MQMLMPIQTRNASNIFIYIYYAIKLCISLFERRWRWLSLTSISRNQANFSRHTVVLAVVVEQQTREIYYVYVLV